MSEPTHSYVGIAPCGCARAAVVDSDGDRLGTAHAVANWIEMGRVVERVTVDEAMRLLNAHCPHAAPDCTSSEATP
ncbi:MAG TPA: hypothetical protein VGM37_14620 [Armatimonadota bacterium]|jgi:hypothetical protein